MVGSATVTYVRLAATAVITGFAAIYPYYPSWYWITAVIAAGSAIGIHAIPAVGQSKGEIRMSEPNGLQLMGLQPSGQTPEPGQPEPAAEAPEVTGVPKVAEVTEVPAEAGRSRQDPAEVLRAAAAMLNRAADQL